MLPSLTSRLIVLVLAASPAMSPATPGGAHAGEVVPSTADPTTVGVPPGSPADLALWRKTYDLDNELPIERSVASRLQLRAKTGALLERLGAQREQGAIPAERARALEAELTHAWRASAALLVERWPVDPTRVCGYELLLFESVLRSDESPRKATQLDETRASVLGCVTRAELPLRELHRVNPALEKAIDEAERAIAAAEPPPKTLTTPAAAPGPSAQR